MSKYYLLTLDTNWADELDIDAHIAMEEKEFNTWKKDFNRIEFPYTIGIGTNEDIEINKEDIKIKEITKRDYTVLVKLNLKERGFSNCINVEIYDDEWDEEE